MGRLQLGHCSGRRRRRCREGKHAGPVLHNACRKSLAQAADGRGHRAAHQKRCAHGEAAHRLGLGGVSAVGGPCDERVGRRRAVWPVPRGDPERDPELWKARVCLPQRRESAHHRVHVLRPHGKRQVHVRCLAPTVHGSAAHPSALSPRPLCALPPPPPKWRRSASAPRSGLPCPLRCLSASIPLRCACAGPPLKTVLLWHACLRPSLLECFVQLLPFLCILPSRTSPPSSFTPSSLSTASAPCSLCFAHFS